MGNFLAWVLADSGSDEGMYCKFSVPKNYVGAPKLVIRGILDGVPGASDVLAFGVRKLAVANNESADGAFDAEELANATIGSSGSNHANEDEFELAITLVAGNYAVDDSVLCYVFLDASVNSYGGNVLLVADDCIFFEYADA